MPNETETPPTPTAAADQPDAQRARTADAGEAARQLEFGDAELADEVTELMASDPEWLVATALGLPAAAAFAAPPSQAGAPRAASGMVVRHDLPLSDDNELALQAAAVRAASALEGSLVRVWDEEDKIWYGGTVTDVRGLAVLVAFRNANVSPAWLDSSVDFIVPLEGHVQERDGYDMPAPLPRPAPPSAPPAAPPSAPPSAPPDARVSASTAAALLRDVAAQVVGNDCELLGEEEGVASASASASASTAASAAAAAKPTLVIDTERAPSGEAREVIRTLFSELADSDGTALGVMKAMTSWRDQNPPTLVESVAMLYAYGNLSAATFQAWMDCAPWMTPVLFDEPAYAGGLIPSHTTVETAETLLRFLRRSRVQIEGAPVLLVGVAVLHGLDALGSCCLTCCDPRNRAYNERDPTRDAALFPPTLCDGEELPGSGAIAAIGVIDALHSLDGPRTLREIASWMAGLISRPLIIDGALSGPGGFLVQPVLTLL